MSTDITLGAGFGRTPTRVYTAPDDPETLNVVTGDDVTCTRGQDNSVVIRPTRGPQWVFTVPGSEHTLVQLAGDLASRQDCTPNVDEPTQRSAFARIPHALFRAIMAEKEKLGLEGHDEIVGHLVHALDNAPNPVVPTKREVRDTFGATEHRFFFRGPSAASLRAVTTRLQDTLGRPKIGYLEVLAAALEAHVNPSAVPATTAEATRAPAYVPDTAQTVVVRPADATPNDPVGFCRIPSGLHEAISAERDRLGLEGGIDELVGLLLDALQKAPAPVAIPRKSAIVEAFGADTKGLNFRGPSVSRLNRTKDAIKRTRRLGDPRPGSREVLVAAWQAYRAQPKTAATRTPTADTTPAAKPTDQMQTLWSILQPAVAALPAPTEPSGIVWAPGGEVLASDSAHDGVAERINDPRLSPLFAGLHEQSISIAAVVGPDGRKSALLGVELFRGDETSPFATFQSPAA